MSFLKYLNMIVKSHHKKFTYYLFRDDNTEIEFIKKKGASPKIKGDIKLAEKDKETIKKYFKKT